MKNNISDLILLESFFQSDERGDFIKTYNKDLFESRSINFSIEESYISSSKKNTLRGMHYQKEPYGHKKLVYCSHGKALDVCVDLRKSSKNYGCIESFILVPDDRCVLIPKGVAHGFLALEDETIMNYYTSSVYNQNADSGILWSSIDFDWPITNPIISERDLNHPQFGAYDD
jgi:dTDP-4-dehydrorhamnose 3,5-epimerase